VNIFANSSRKTSLGRRLKTLGIAAGAISLLAGSALGADLPTRKGPPIAPVYVPPPFTWTGFYVGVNAGGAWASRNNNNNLGFPFVGALPFGGGVPFATSGNGGNQSGFIGGVQAGYNYQFGIGSGFVIGGETDIDWANINRSHNNVAFGSFTLPQFPGTLFTPSNIATTSRNNNQYIGTVRLRAGYAWDRILLYATGGLAYGGVNNQNNVGSALTATTLSCAICVVPGTGGATNVTGVPVNTVFATQGGRSSSTKTGWTVGGGVEYAFTPNWTVKGEYLYENFGHSNSAPGFLLPGAAAVFNNSNRSINVNVVRLGVNYKFW
jgi:outer membrane immunogenic protein